MMIITYKLYFGLYSVFAFLFDYSITSLTRVDVDLDFLP